MLENSKLVLSPLVHGIRDMQWHCYYGPLFTFRENIAGETMWNQTQLFQTPWLAVGFSSLCCHQIREGNNSPVTSLSSPVEVRTTVLVLGIRHPMCISLPQSVECDVTSASSRNEPACHSRSHDFTPTLVLQPDGRRLLLSMLSNFPCT